MDNIMSNIFDNHIFLLCGLSKSNMGLTVNVSGWFSIPANLAEKSKMAARRVVVTSTWACSRQLCVVRF